MKSLNLTLLIFLSLINFCKLHKNDKKYFEVTAKSGLILRSGPGQDYEKITTLPIKTVGKIIRLIGNPIYIQEKKGRWLEVETEHLNGFIFSGFVVTHENLESLNRSQKNISFQEFKGITPFVKSNYSLAEISQKSFENFKEYEEDLKLETKTILEINNFKILLVSSKNEYSDYRTIIVHNKINGNNFIPELNNFHPISIAENSKIISGIEYACYNCCATPIELFAILAEDKIYTVSIPITDTVASCDLEGQVQTDFSQLRLTKKNDIIIHKTIYDCSHDPNCSKDGAEDNCKPTMVYSDKFILIENPFYNPNIFEFEAKIIPEKILNEFKTGRKANINNHIN
ncbi:hypothetical protein CLV96_3998 [Leptospira meyeri]|uniref:SH3 domain-containing protein n=1 Tax=Leptospira meyeri TaxID=29508 RepID=A0A4R8MIJ1_LEPME|nr:SH3 domain-containing protein [Leptospira meyeri]EKJ87603.1 hypothetical protein LEP1GSC017_0474 [Leptospira meyeri serovar Hardjo str. Went 5]TDY66145.1 hypothetical protein CLV96_3998 [Leptospira meyeri]